MNIPQGYKQTELGIIPEDWKVKPIGECLSIGNGCDYKNKPFGNIPVYGTGGVITYINDYLYDGPTICIGRKGTINKPLYYEGKIWTVDTLYYTYNFIDVNVKYIYYLLLTIDWMSLNEATGVPSLTSDRIRHILLALPPVAEQQAIAETLSDIDGLIAALDKKIAKKRLIKQGAMQQLLTGKKRLSKYTDKWEYVRFGDCAEIYRGGSPRPIEKFITKQAGGINWIKIGDVKSNDKYINRTEERIIPEGVSRSRQVYVGDFILSNSMSFGRPYILNIEGCIHDGWLVIQNYHGHFDKDFLYYILCSEDIMAQYIGMAAGSSVKNLNKDKVASLLLFIPKTIDEQQAIATILSDMDKEIADLEAKRDKYRLLKSGMMQKLLTGQIRLTKPLTKVVSLVPEASVAREIPVDAHILAGHIVNRLWQSKGWGRTKLQKSLHLIGYCLQLNLGNEYIRNTAGPDDQLLMNYIDQKFKQYRHVNIKKERRSDGTVHYSYIPTPLIQELEMAYEQYPQNIREHIDVLLDKLSTMNLAGAEILSTLYSVWNNRIIKGEQITDDLLLADFYAWSQHKADFEEIRVRNALDYMRKENIVPIGWGKYIDKR